MKYSTAHGIILLLILSAAVPSAVFAQDEAGAVFDARQRTERNREENSGNAYVFRRMRGRFILPNLPKEAWALLNPTKEEFTANKEYLSQNKLNLAKSYPDADCQRNIVNLSNEKCFRHSQTFGLGSYYSFRKKVNVRSGWTDLYFSKGEMITIAFPMSVGIIANLGNVAIETIDEDSPFLGDLQNFQVPKTRAGIKKLQIDLSQTIKSGKTILTSHQRLNADSTFALRLIFHEDDRLYETGNREYLIIMRIVSINPDGSYLFAWKKIAEKKISKLEKL